VTPVPEVIAADVARLATLVNEVVDRLDALTAPPPMAAASGDTEPTGDAAATTVYETVEAWYDDWFAPMHERAWTNGHGWCHRWAEHPEAHHRLTALWTAWEALHGAPVGMATWWVQYADPTLAALRDEHGPFTACTLIAHTTPEPLARGSA
jgi:hypothetical protein